VHSWKKVSHRPTAELKTFYNGTFCILFWYTIDTEQEHLNQTFLLKSQLFLLTSVPMKPCSVTNWKFSSASEPVAQECLG
jgi:hypothetical protein